MTHQLLLGFIGFLGLLFTVYFLLTAYVLRQQVHATDAKRQQMFMGNFYPPRMSVEGCRMKHIDPFSDEVMRHIPDIGELSCPTLGLDVSVAMGRIFLGNGGVASVEGRTITRDGSLGEFFDLYDSVDIIEKNQSGAMQNLLTKVCIVPESYDHNKPPAEIELGFSGTCRSNDAQFTYTSDGRIRHKLTKKCFGPRGGEMAKLAENTLLVLSDNCTSKFVVIHGGVLKLEGGSKCLHPLWGGDPSESKKLCLYSTCTAQNRLTYRWYVNKKPDTTTNSDNKSFPLTTEMSHIKVNLLNDEVMDTYIDTYALSVLPKYLPTIIKPSVQPNIVVICLEEASVQHFERKLRLTNATMSKMEFLRYKMHSAISPSANENIMNTVLGNTRKKSSKDDSIFKLAKTYNYISMFSADDPASIVGVERGLNDVTHNSLPFFQVLKKSHQLGGASCYCLTGQPIYNITFNYLYSFLESYSNHPRLAFILLSEVCRSLFDNLAYIGYMDEQLTKLLGYLNTLKNTIVFMKSLKGGTTERLKKIEQGRDEIKRPFLATFVSKDIRHKHKFEVTRSDELSTGFDVYATLRHLISHEEESHAHGKTLLKSSELRNCTQTDIHSKMCPCAGQGENV